MSQVQVKLELDCQSTTIMHSVYWLVRYFRSSSKFVHVSGGKNGLAELLKFMDCAANTRSSMFRSKSCVTCGRFTESAKVLLELELEIVVRGAGVGSGITRCMLVNVGMSGSGATLLLFRLLLPL